MKRALFALLCCLMATGCDRTYDRRNTLPDADSVSTDNPYALGELWSGGRAAMPLTVEADRSPADLSLAYTHRLNVEMAAPLVSRRFNELRNLCLTDKTLSCILLNTSQLEKPNGYWEPIARLTVRLPHAGLEKFGQAVLAPGAGGRSIVRVLSNATSAEDLATPIHDATQRFAQLTDYRDRLNTIARRADVRAEELIKIEGELSNTQKAIDEIATEQANLNRRVQTELLTVEFYPAATFATAWEPINQAFKNAGQTLGANVGEALRFSIAVLPFIPLIAIGFVIASYGWKLFRRVQGRGASPKKEAPRKTEALD